MSATDICRNPMAQQNNTTPDYPCRKMNFLLISGKEERHGHEMEAATT
jgi:hypothetical protein